MTATYIRRVLLVLTVGALCAFGVLVASDGIHVRDLGDGDFTEIQLEDLADGESRTFGEGEHEIVITRNGSQLSLEFPGRDGDHGEIILGGMGHTLDCAGDNNCTISVSDNGHMIMINTDRAHTGMGMIGSSIAKAFTFVTSGDVEGMEGEVHIIKIGKGEGEDGEGENVWISGGHGGHGSMFLHSMGDKVTLRCTEGDTTMMVNKDDAEGSFYCPQHKTLLEKVSGHGMMKTIELHIDTDGEHRGELHEKHDDVY